jgi:hypothetical protein
MKKIMSIILFVMVIVLYLIGLVQTAYCYDVKRCDSCGREIKVVKNNYEADTGNYTALIITRKTAKCDIFYTMDFCDKCAMVVMLKINKIRNRQQKK